MTKQYRDKDLRDDAGWLTHFAFTDSQGDAIAAGSPGGAVAVECHLADEDGGYLAASYFFSADRTRELGRRFLELADTAEHNANQKGRDQ